MLGRKGGEMNEEEEVAYNRPLILIFQRKRCMYIVYNWRP